jgi:hypothetical protein
MRVELCASKQRIAWNRQHLVIFLMIAGQL